MSALPIARIVLVGVATFAALPAVAQPAAKPARTMTMTGVSVITESDPTQIGQVVQDFDVRMRSLSGQVTNETECGLFASLSVLAGSDHGLDSPGHTQLVRRPDGTFDVNSSFSIANTISFVGKAGGLLEGMSGSTTTTVGMGTPMTPGEAGKQRGRRIFEEAREGYHPLTIAAVERVLP